MSSRLRIAKKIVAIVRPELAPLMKILGVEEVFEADETTVTELIKGVVQLDDVGIVLTQKSLIEKIPSSIMEDLQSRLYPITVVLPDSIDDGKKSSMDIYRDIIMRFIGFELHIKT